MHGEHQSPIFRISARGKLFLAAEDVEAALVEWALKTDESIPADWMTSHNHLAIVGSANLVVGLIERQKQFMTTVRTEIAGCR